MQQQQEEEEGERKEKKDRSWTYLVWRASHLIEIVTISLWTEFQFLQVIQ